MTEYTECSGCGKEIAFHMSRCFDCSMKEKEMADAEIPIYYCTQCGKKIGFPHSGKCDSCWLGYDPFG